MDKIERLIDKVLESAESKKRNMSEGNKTPKSEAQRVFKEAVDRFIEKEVDMGVFSRDEITSMMMYSFHDPKTIAVDGALYDIMRHGQADYGFGGGLYSDITESLDKAGYYLEPDRGGIYHIAKGGLV